MASIPTDFYFVEVDNSYLKFGTQLTLKIVSRYTDCFYRIELDRASAWTLYMYLVTYGLNPPHQIHWLWGGNTELRTVNKRNY